MIGRFIENMKKQKLLNVLLAVAVALICVRLSRDFEPALLGAVVCIALYMVFSREKNEK